MRITDKKYYEDYNKLIGNQIDKLIESYDFSAKSIDLGYNTQASAVYSSNIEGNSIDLNSFMNHKLAKTKLKPDKEIQEIENLINAYKFAQNNQLNEKNFQNCHKIFSKTLVIKGNRGKYRNEQVGVFSASGLVYLAIEPEFVPKVMSELFVEIDELLKMNLPSAEVFYFASLIHLNFAHIHPFKDGNGRAARLLEKWFISEKMGEQFWKLSSEKYYKEHQQEYYQKINLGVNYYTINYDKCLPFLLMLPNAIKFS